MAGNLSNFAENKILDHVLNVTQFTPPSAFHAGLLTTAASDSSPGIEVLGNGYLRQEILFAAAANGTTSNTNTLTFTASGSGWGNVVAVGLYDAGSPGVGNLWWYGPLVATRNMASGNVLTFAPGALVVSID